MGPTMFHTRFGTVSVHHICWTFLSWKTKCTECKFIKLKKGRVSKDCTCMNTTLGSLYIFNASTFSGLPFHIWITSTHFFPMSCDYLYPLEMTSLLWLKCHDGNNLLKPETSKTTLLKTVEKPWIKLPCSTPSLLWIPDSCGLTVIIIWSAES